MPTEPIRSIESDIVPGDHPYLQGASNIGRTHPFDGDGMCGEGYRMDPFTLEQQGCTHFCWANGADIRTGLLGHA